MWVEMQKSGHGKMLECYGVRYDHWRWRIRNLSIITRISKHISKENADWETIGISENSPVRASGNRHLTVCLLCSYQMEKGSLQEQVWLDENILWAKHKVEKLRNLSTNSVTGTASNMGRSWTYQTYWLHSWYQSHRRTGPKTQRQTTSFDPCYNPIPT